MVVFTCVQSYSSFITNPILSKVHGRLVWTDLYFASRPIWWSVASDNRMPLATIWTDGMALIQISHSLRADVLFFHKPLSSVWSFFLLSPTKISVSQATHSDSFPDFERFQCWVIGCIRHSWASPVSLCFSTPLRFFSIFTTELVHSVDAGQAHVKLLFFLSPFLDGPYHLRVPVVVRPTRTPHPRKNRQIVWNINLQFGDGKYPFTVHRFHCRANTMYWFLFCDIHVGRGCFWCFLESNTAALSFSNNRVS